jgi:hypothetical protein
MGCASVWWRSTGCRHAAEACRGGSCWAWGCAAAAPAVAAPYRASRYAVVATLSLLSPLSLPELLSQAEGGSLCKQMHAMV